MTILSLIASGLAGWSLSQSVEQGKAIVEINTKWDVTDLSSHGQRLTEIETRYFTEQDAQELRADIVGERRELVDKRIAELEEELEKLRLYIAATSGKVP